MRPGLLAGLTVAATGLWLGALTLPLAGQGANAGAPSLVITAYNGGPPIPYSIPRTPWGEPDLQGTWSSDDATCRSVVRRNRRTCI